MTDEETMKRVRNAGKAILDQAMAMSNKEVARELAKLACSVDLVTALNQCENEMIRRSNL